MLILKDEHAIDVLKSGNTGHLWHDFHAIGVHATDVGHPSEMARTEGRQGEYFPFASNILVIRAHDRRSKM